MFVLRYLVMMALVFCWCLPDPQFSQQFSATIEYISINIYKHCYDGPIHIKWELGIWLKEVILGFRNSFTKQGKPLLTKLITAGYFSQHPIAC